MAKAIIFGVLFVTLCVVIPGLIGLYHNQDYRQAEVEKKVIEQIGDSIETNTDSNTVTDITDDDLGPSSESNTTNDQTLAFTREEAVEAILDQFTFTELLRIYSKVQNGMNKEDKQEIMSMLEERFTDEEIEALMVIGFSELEKVLY